jgi:hypothetical protein
MAVSEEEGYERIDRAGQAAQKREGARFRGTAFDAEGLNLEAANT